MNHTSTNYDSRFDESEFANRYYQKHQKMAQKLGLIYINKLTQIGFTNGKILDVGCGFGGTLFVLANKFSEAELIGIDLSEPLLKIAKQKTAELGFTNRLEFQKRDVHQLPFESDSFDVVLNLNMVHLVKEPVIMLNEIERVLKSNGKFFIKDLRRSWLRIFEGEIKNAFSKEEAGEILNQSDLRSGLFTTELLWWNYENLPISKKINK